MKAEQGRIRKTSFNKNTTDSELYVKIIQGTRYAL